MDVNLLDVTFACKFFSDVILNVILYHAWRVSALRAPKISHELYIYDIHQFQILHGCDAAKSSHLCMDVNGITSITSQILDVTLDVGTSRGHP